ncbi:hypothetical protein PT279_01085 [Bifidobacterium sp. ESL0784]|uniref:hypothetical protein n=1 Tax=Bifidobacterium sp. ESL0784 TaxID=2983231 RepID=UPI0023F81C6A|nr:hypothetical protein [Bifidobacterium sp. ESL0784]MDF7640192.1 hypothetical protein [Bifidobacterium sp. ESL0784]
MAIIMMPAQHGVRSAKKQTISTLHHRRESDAPEVIAVDEKILAAAGVSEEEITEIVWVLAA